MHSNSDGQPVVKAAPVALRVGLGRLADSWVRMGSSMAKKQGVVDSWGRLAELFLARARSAWGTTVRGFGAGVMDALCAHDWPGNVRQLRNAVERASALAVGARIELHDLPPEIAGRVTQDEGTPPDGPASLTDRVNAFERRLIHEALARADGNQSEAARLLRVPRRTLAHKVKRHGLA